MPDVKMSIRSMGSKRCEKRLVCHFEARISVGIVLKIAVSRGPEPVMGDLDATTVVVFSPANVLVDEMALAKIATRVTHVPVRLHGGREQTPCGRNVYRLLEDPGAQYVNN